MLPQVRCVFMRAWKDGGLRLLFSFFRGEPFTIKEGYTNFKSTGEQHSIRGDSSIFIKKEMETVDFFLAFSGDLQAAVEQAA